MESIRTGHLVLLEKSAPALVLRESSDEALYTDMAYENELRFCAERGIICLEYHRRHGVGRTKRSVQGSHGGQERSP